MARSCRALACSFASALKCSSACPVAGLWWAGADPQSDPSKDTSWPRAAPPASTPAASLSRRSPNLSRSPSSSLSRPTASTGWSATSAWEAAVERRRGEGEDVSSKSGLQEIFEEISPIEDFSETMSLSFENPVFYDPKYTVDECKEKDFTYSAPLYVSAEFTNNDTGEIKGQTVFMGDFPLMTPKGTFVINGTERVVVSQLVRSPGRLLRAHRRQDVRQGHLHRQAHPVARRLARVRDRQARPGRRPPRPQAQAERHGAAQGPRPDHEDIRASSRPRQHRGRATSRSS